MVCWGCWHGLLRLDPEADISTIQLVGPQTSRKEIKSLYYDVYKLWRLPGSPPGEPELVAEVVSSLEDCQGQERSKPPQAMRKSKLTDIWPPRNRTPRRVRRDASVERSLAEVREFHQKTLAMAATLEEDIEWLSCPCVRSQSEAWAHSRSRDHHRCRSRGWKRRCHQVQLEDCCAPYFEYHPSQKSLESEGEVAATEDVNLEELPELGPEVTCFLQGSAKSLGEENVKVSSPEPPIEEIQKWVAWKARAYETPRWWQELTMAPGVDDYKKLAHKVWASSQLPKRASEQWWVKNDHKAPPAPPCLLWKDFLLPPDSIFACWDIQKIQHEKMVAYAWALQFWVEKVNLPTGGKPCLLAGCVIELWEERECYLSFSNKNVFEGVALPEETPAISPKEVTPWSAQPTPTGTPVKEATMDMTVEPVTEKRFPNKFPGWEKVLHPSRPIVTTRQIPPLSRGPRQRPHSWSLGKGLVWIPQTKELGVTTTQSDPPHLPKSWGLSNKWPYCPVLLGWLHVCREIIHKKGFPTPMSRGWQYWQGLL